MLRRSSNSSADHNTAASSQERKASRTPTAEFAVRIATIVLAVGSTTFAAQMISTPDRVPTFAGAEHLMIFARPSTLAAQRNTGNQSLMAANKNGIDYTPVGSVGGNHSPSAFLKYDVIESNGTTALVRDSRGALIRVSKGDVVTGLGRVQSIARTANRWMVVTSLGVIIEKPAPTSAQPGSARR
jgi:hypothetical protein